MNFDYFYGAQAESYSFIRVPRLLITGEDFKGLSTDAKLLYSLLLDRMGLSMRSGWLDEEGRVYIYYTVEEIQDNLNCGHGKACKLLAELDTVKGIGLIERKKQGQGKPTRIYVKQFVEKDIDPPPGQPKNGNPQSRKSDGCAAENGKSGRLKSGNPDISKTEGSYIYNSYTENSYTDPSIYPAQSPLENHSACLEQLKEQVDYPLLSISYMDDTPDGILELICDVLCSTAPGIKIGGETIPIEKAKARFRKLRFEHISYVLDSMYKTTSDIKNIRAYLLTALYNAPLTIDPYYSAAVRHDSA